MPGTANAFSDSKDTKQGKSAPKKSKSAGVPRQQMTLRMHPDLHTQIQYWANRRGVSMADYVTDAVTTAIGRENGDYDLPTLEMQRLARIEAVVVSLSHDVNNLNDSTRTSLDTLINLTRSSNYFTDSE